jgi:hypothetical protein
VTNVAHVRARVEGEHIIEGFPVPTRIDMEFEGVSFPLDGSMTAVLTGGHYVVETMSVRRQAGGPEISTDLLRRVPVSTLVRTAIMATAIEQGSWFHSADPEDLQRELAKGPTEENLRRIARVYRIAYLSGEAPTAAVATACALPRSTAGRWVRLARQRGFLGPTRERVAGPGEGA